LSVTAYNVVKNMKDNKIIYELSSKTKYDTFIKTKNALRGFNKDKNFGRLKQNRINKTLLERERDLNIFLFFF